MSDKKERIDRILTQTVANTKDSAKLNSLLYRDKAKEDKVKEKKTGKGKGNNSENTSMLSFMWGTGPSSPKEKKSVNKTTRHKDLLGYEDKTIIKESPDAVEISKDGISLRLAESKEGKLKLKIATGKRKDISKKRLAKIAMNAIIKELKKEE